MAAVYCYYYSNSRVLSFIGIVVMIRLVFFGTVINIESVKVMPTESVIVS